jgi:hypothetical protein
MPKAVRFAEYGDIDVLQLDARVAASARSVLAFGGSS